MRALDRYNLLLALLLALLLWLNQQPAEEPRPLLQIDAMQIKEIRVVRDRHLRLSLLRDTQGWMLMHPNIERAAVKRAGTLLGLLHAPSHWQTQADTANLQTYGLEQPVLSISFDDNAIHFGDASVPPGRRYVLVKNQVHLIDENHFRIASLPAKHFREQP